MGRVAAQYADLAVITSDNPRTESPMAIIRAIEIGFREIGHVSQYRLIEDRACAIHEAIGLARAGDVVVIAGKGHETYQIVGDQRSRSTIGRWPHRSYRTLAIRRRRPLRIELRDQNA
jgi:UDP-N-acetylmuramyl tripeptide synthase